MALIAAVSNGLPLALRMILVAVLLPYSLVQLRWLAWPRWTWVAIDDGKLVLRREGQDEIRLVPGRHAFVSPLFIGLAGRVTGTGRRLRMGLFRDQVDQDAFRRLAVFLRSSGSP